MYDLIIKNGYVVSPVSTIKTDVGIKKGKVVCLGDLKEDKANRVVDAEGKYVMPGVIEAHMHCMAPFQGCSGANDFYEQSVSGAFGGVTMFMDFTNTFKGTSLMEVIKKRHEEMSLSAIDFGIHGKIVEAPEQIIDEIEEVVKYGCPTFKMFMTYKKEGVMSSDETLIKVFKKAKELGALPMIHAESNAIAELNIEDYRQQNDLSWVNFAKSKPILCEVEAFERAVRFAEYVGNGLLIVHTTNEEALNIARKAQAKDIALYVETGPHYLTLFNDLYEGKDGHLAICSPPLRTPKEAEALWRGLSDGTILLTGSDDCTFTYKEKSCFLEKDENGEFIQDFTKVVNGLSGLEIRLPILLSEGVGKGRLSINKVCELTSTNIAKIYGCYPQKGIIQPGSDADIVIVDMEKEVTLSKDVLHNNIDYCLHGSMKIKGYPIMTLSKGRVIVENGKFYGEKGGGEFVRRSINPEYLKHYGIV